MRSGGLILIVAAAVVLAACDSADEPSPAAAAKHPQNPCSKSRVKDGVREFLSSASAGDAERLDAAIAQEPAFRQFSTSFNYGSKPKRFFASKDRDEVIRRLMDRHAQGDRYRLLTLHRGDYDRSFKICNLGFTIDRRIEAGPWRPFVGKGALDARTGTVAVWNVGGELPSEQP